MAHTVIAVSTPCGAPSISAGQLVAAVSILGLGAVNYVGIEQGNRAQAILTTIKIGALATIPFVASVTIGQNRLIPSTNPATPSQHPICKQRIVTPITIDFRPHAGGTLLVTIDPSAWFETTDFTTLPQLTAPPPLVASIGGADHRQ